MTHRATRVDLRSDRFEMGGIHARALTAQVVDLLPRWNRPDLLLVHRAMCVTKASAEADAGVAVRSNADVHDPAFSRAPVVLEGVVGRGDRGSGSAFGSRVVTVDVAQRLTFDLPASLRLRRDRCSFSATALAETGSIEIDCRCSESGVMAVDETLWLPARVTEAASRLLREWRRFTASTLAKARFHAFHSTSERGPFYIHLSDERKAHKPPVTFLSIAKL